jgi:hypothetical protein
MYLYFAFSIFSLDHPGKWIVGKTGTQLLPKSPLGESDAPSDIMQTPGMEKLILKIVF